MAEWIQLRFRQKLVLLLFSQQVMDPIISRAGGLSSVCELLINKLVITETVT